MNSMYLPPTCWHVVTWTALGRPSACGSVQSVVGPVTVPAAD